MLTLKTLKWSNCFSYGQNNRIDFDINPLTQLVGGNGAGKTSISLILQEILYGKNNKNIKKQDIANNKTDVKGYSICLFFEKDGTNYSVHLDRKSSLKLRLMQEDEDISSHTSLNTYKTLADIIGIADFKLFCQLIYQHSTNSLEFLTATDTNRKKFLINLLQLERYLELHELFKDKSKIVLSEITSLEGGISTIEAWINKHEDMNFVKLPLMSVPEVNPEWYDRQSTYKSNIENINSINRKISNNNQYIKDLNNIDSKYYTQSPPMVPVPSAQKLTTDISILNSELKRIESKLNKLNNIGGVCIECLQEVDDSITQNMIQIEENSRDEIKQKISTLMIDRDAAKITEAEIAKYRQAKNEFERLNQLIDRSLPTKTLDLAELRNKLTEITNLIRGAETERKKAELENNKISAHNSKIDVVKKQLDEMKTELHEKNIKLIEKENLNDILELLKKTFSTNGLVSYKIESSIKELESKINEYLSDLSDFQMYFKLSGEKLNLEIFDGKNNQISIQNLSSGETARLNLACVLAIRNTLSSLTNTKINLLFLDEITGSLDAEGKEKFTEILLEEDLNTFFISHEWTHPLVPKVRIIKEHNISRIEYD